MTLSRSSTSTPDYGPRRLTVELTNICNLHCSYCLRDEDALYHDPANYLPLDLFKKIATGARETMKIDQVTFTGGEPTLHPDFPKLLAAVAELGLKCSFVTNGWHFDRIWPALAEQQNVVTHVSFSLDGVTRESHDRWRGAGSFDRVVRAFTRCWANQLPFNLKVGIRRDTLPELESIAIFAARMGAAGLSFGHLMPTSAGVEDASALTVTERAEAEREIALLARIFKMRIGIDVGYYNLDPAAPCSALSGVSANVNYRGELSLCCNLSGFRGSTGDDDVVADLKQQDFKEAFGRLQQVAKAQSEQRISVLNTYASEGTKPELRVGSPCLFCLDTLGKTPWNSKTPARSLPVLV
jgi:MoaA/NifB/PqqE/SkfB family radical SAM enzyme